MYGMKLNILNSDPVTNLVIPNWTLSAQPNVAIATPSGIIKLKLPSARVPNS